MVKDVDELRKHIRAYDLEKYEDLIVSMARPAIQMIRERIADDDMPIGASKLGGLPDLPPDYQWRYYNGKPLTFIAQFKLSDVSPHDVDKVLPASGMLYFFYEADEAPWGFHEEKDSWQILYIDSEDPSALKRTAHPTHQWLYRQFDALPSHHLRFEQHISLPTLHFYKGDVFQVDFDYREQELYWAIYVKTRRNLPHRILGHPALVQGPVEWDSVVNSEQIDLKQYDDKRDHIRATMKEWQFLFQIDHDRSLEIMWHDGGTAYVCIPKASLAKRQFEDCWTILQTS